MQHSFWTSLNRQQVCLFVLNKIIAGCFSLIEKSNFLKDINYIDDEKYYRLMRSSFCVINVLANSISRFFSYSIKTKCMKNSVKWFKTRNFKRRVKWHINFKLAFCFFHFHSLRNYKVGMINQSFSHINFKNCFEHKNINSLKIFSKEKLCCKKDFQ